MELKAPQLPPMYPAHAPMLFLGPIHLGIFGCSADWVPVPQTPFLTIYGDSTRAAVSGHGSAGRIRPTRRACMAPRVFPPRVMYRDPVRVLTPGSILKATFGSSAGSLQTWSRLPLIQFSGGTICGNSRRARAFGRG